MKASLLLGIIFHVNYTIPRGILVAQMVKNLPTMQETLFDPWVGKIPWRRDRQPTPGFLTGESPWTEEPGKLPSMRSQTVRYDCTKQYTVLKHSLLGYNISPVRSRCSESFFTSLMNFVYHSTFLLCFFF